MHQRHIVTAFCVGVLLLFFLNRQHVDDLAEVVETYSGFYPYLRQHTWTLLRYQRHHDGSTELLDFAAPLTPPILHHIFLTDGRAGTSFVRYEADVQSCGALHQNWTHYVWNDTSADKFVREYYPKLYPHYVSYGQSIQRANVLRYTVLHHYGGVYLDLDIVCLKPLDGLRRFAWLTPAAYPAGVNNAFILSRAYHPLLQSIILELPKRDLQWGFPYVTNMLSTGCMFFSNRWMSYARSLLVKLGKGGTVAEEDKIYVLADELGMVEPHMLRGVVTTPLFKHGGASTWHGWDATAILLIGNHYGYFALLLCTILVNVLVLTGLQRWHKRLHWRRWCCIEMNADRRSSNKIDQDERMPRTATGSADARSVSFALRSSGPLPL